MRVVVAQVDGLGHVVRIDRSCLPIAILRQHFETDSQGQRKLLEIHLVGEFPIAQVFHMLKILIDRCSWPWLRMSPFR